MKVTVHLVSAFIADNEGGNIAGVVLSADNLTSQEMQQIALEAGCAETAFVVKDDLGYKLRFFDPLVEVDLCGHATIAAWALMRTSNGLNSGKYVQHTNVGQLDIEVSSGGMIFMEQASPHFGESVSIVEVSLSLGIKKSMIREDLVPQVVSTGLDTLVVGLENQDALSQLQPDIALMSELSAKYNFTLVHPYVLLENNDTLAAVRNFGPNLGVFEDVATGTSNAALLCYLKERGLLLPKNIYKIEQGRILGRPSYIYGKFEGEKVWVGGTAKEIGQIEIEMS